MTTGECPCRRQEFLLSTVKCRKLSWFGHVCRHDTLSNIIRQGTVDGDGSRRRVRPRKLCEGNVKECTGQSLLSLMRIADDKKSMSDHQRRAIRRSATTTPGRHRT